MNNYNQDSLVCVTSYNSTGFGQDKIDFMKTLLEVPEATTSINLNLTAVPKRVRNKH